MSSSMGSGMFPGQQSAGPHPVGGPGQPGLLSGAPGNRVQGPNTLVDDLEASFEACFASLVSQDYVNGTDQEEIRTGVDQCIQKFLDVARQTECFFLQKRLQLSVQKPDQVVKEDVSELRNELQRKELLVQKHLSKLHHWQQVDNTDAEGRLVLADALCYAHSFNPRAIVNAATLTGAMDVALGSAATGVFTNSDWLWEQLHKASVVTGDRVWRMPLFQHYTRQVTDCQLADLNNVGKYSRSGGACTAAAFLREFVTAPHWAHLDIAGVMTNKDEVPYLKKGMSGRPTRTLVEFAAGLANQA